MKTPALALAAAVALTGIISAAQAEDGNWLVRGRIINVKPTNNGGETSIGGKPKAGSDTVPEVDVTYFATPNIGFELIAATTEHKTQVARGTNADLGTVKLLPPTLTAQYHFTNLDKFKPYVGAGLTYAHFYDADHPGFGSVKYDDSVGVALQAGVDYKLTDKIYLNADVKQIFVGTDVTVNDTITAKANLNPIVAGIGVGYRF
ncbi:MAG: OmpW family protein [Blastochloris viridis]|uniref:OmpW family protein n=1 Tax=Blastochloris viridis TaxID=1079 RepID=A0A6N4R8U7_BLAVI|nr:MAG: OmpW family protein [Blastochloris viridis]